MSPQTLSRLCGLALITGGLLAMGAHWVHPEAPTSPADIAPYVAATQMAHLVLLLAMGFLLLGMPAMITRQQHRAGRSGLAGALLTTVGVAIVDGLHSVIEFGMLPVMAARVPEATEAIMGALYGESLFALTQMVGMGLVVIGTAVLAWSTWRAAVFPRWIVGSQLVFLAMLLGNFVPGVAGTPVLGSFPLFLYAPFVGYGATLLMDRNPVVLTRSPASQVPSPELLGNL
jgi:hypothetical protein